MQAYSRTIPSFGAIHADGFPARAFVTPEPSPTRLVFQNHGCTRTAQDQTLRLDSRPPRSTRSDLRGAARHAAGASAARRSAQACPPVYDQGQLGSCTAQAIAAALQFDQAKQAERDVFTPSRLFIYYNERAIEGTVDDDSGAMLRDGIKSVAKQGAPHESLWPHVIARFRHKPSAAAYRDGRKHEAVLYERLVPVAEQLKGCLAAGYPFAFGFSVYESFESAAVARTGEVPMPGRDESLLGGHAVVAVGYDEPRRRFFVRNSWGTSWGRAGYFTMPYDYLIDQHLSDDFWTIKLVE
ncbi:MAG TPA: C1 family peptidase [Vicinamibacterales bacterium]|nr:C1 family peptidase [Vicinamibacterales bacterium]